MQNKNNWIGPARSGNVSHADNDIDNYDDQRTKKEDECLKLHTRLYQNYTRELAPLRHDRLRFCLYICV